MREVHAGAEVLVEVSFATDPPALSRDRRCPAGGVCFRGARGSSCRGVVRYGPSGAFARGGAREGAFVSGAPRDQRSRSEQFGDVPNPEYGVARNICKRRLHLDRCPVLTETRLARSTPFLRKK